MEQDSSDSESDDSQKKNVLNYSASLECESTYDGIQETVQINKILNFSENTFRFFEKSTHS
jgi:hypothetical protein